MSNCLSTLRKKTLKTPTTTSSFGLDATLDPRIASLVQRNETPPVKVTPLNITVTNVFKQTA